MLVPTPATRLRLHDLGGRTIIQIAGGAGAVSASWVPKLRVSDGFPEMKCNFTLPMEHITSDSTDCEADWS
jgi:hypothetical protein